MRMVTPSVPYFEHLVTLSWWRMTLVSSVTYQLCGPTPEQEPVSPELLWYLGLHPKGEDDSELAVMGMPDSPNEPCVGGHAMKIERLLDTDSDQASTQTEPVNLPSSEISSGETFQDSSEDGLISVPDAVKPCYRYEQQVKLKR